jgi:HNH endonuclease
MMRDAMTPDAARLSDSALTAELGRLAGREREATAALIVHLGEFDARRLYEGAAYPSMFQYCRAVLRLSEGSAYNRIETARAARRHPAIVEMLVSGDLTPTTARLLARHLTAENHQELLAAASGKGKQAVEELLARWFPQADVAARVRRLRSAPLVMGEPVAPSSPPSVAVSLLELPVRAAGAPGDAPILTQVAAMPPAVVRPLAPGRYEIRFTATAETRERLRRAQDLLAHAIPSGDIAQVVDRALMLLVADLERKKFAATPRSHRSRGQAEDSRNIPAEVKRGVVARDEGRCRFVAANGQRCGDRRFLEFHHVIPYAAGGKPPLDNIELRCRAHNGYEAERFYGPGVRRGRGARANRSGTSAPTPAVRAPPTASG